MGKFLKSGDLKEFLTILSKKYDIIAPIETDILRFQKITPKDTDRINFEKNSRVSPVKYLFSTQEVLADIVDGKLVPPANDGKDAIKPQIIFGIRNCDANAIRNMDKMFLEHPPQPDPIYKAKRENTILFAVRCEEPMETCFCESMENIDCFDVKFTQIEDHGFYVEVGSKKGADIVDNMHFIKQSVVKPGEKKHCELKLDNKSPGYTAALMAQYNNPSWEKDAEKCFSCSACNMLCPTCTCFDVKDIVNPDLKSGKRVRVQDACHNRDFTKVAGGFVFRDKRVDRYKHRIYHKVVYFKERFGQYMCTGCGRCISQCPSKINWVNTANSLK